MHACAGARAPKAVLEAQVLREALMDPLFRRFVGTVLLAVGMFIIAAILHNLVAGITGVEEPVFFLIAVLGAPLMLVWGVLQCSWSMWKRRNRHGG
jgi:hypothetical protein